MDGFSFACRRISCWNSLPADVVLIKSLPLFKEKVNYVNYSKYLFIQIPLPFYNILPITLLFCIVFNYCNNTSIILILSITCLNNICANNSVSG